MIRRLGGMFKAILLGLLAVSIPMRMLLGILYRILILLA